MKIAVPWPIKIEGQSRVKEVLDLWEDKKSLLLCLAKPCTDLFLAKFDTKLLNRNSQSIGTKVPKCFISDMVESVINHFPNEDWYGFGNSDIVPLGPLNEDFQDHEVLIYHRTEIKEWHHRNFISDNSRLEKETYDKIVDMRAEGVPDKRIARQLNENGVPVPEPYGEWTYVAIREMLEEQGEVFFWGQDMFMFRRDVVSKILNDYLKSKDPILGTGGFDPRLSRYLMENFKGVRVLNRLFHKTHPSEWSVDDVEYHHNGGDIPMEILYEFYDHNYVKIIQSNGYKSAIPKHLSYLILKNKSKACKKLFPN